MKQRLLPILVGLALLATTLASLPNTALADIELPDRELVVTIESVRALDDFGDEVFSDTADFYGVVTVAGAELPVSPTIDDNDNITPNWEFRTAVDRSIGSVPVRIQVFDEDGGLRLGDDEADLIAGGDRGLDLSVAVEPCSITGDLTADCGTVVTSAGTGNDRAEVTFRIEIFERPVSAELSVLVSRVRALDNFGSDVFPEDADFYGVVSIDGAELPETPEISDDNDISPNWEFQRLVDVTGSAVPVVIRILDGDGGARGDDDEADLAPGDADRKLDIVVDVETCTFSGDVTGACGDTIVSSGTADDRAEITFVIDAVPPPAAEDLRITCMHSPIWPQPGDTVTITATLADENLAALVGDELRIFVDDRTTPAATAATVSTMTHTFTAGADTFFYGCAGERTGLRVFSDFRRVSVGNSAATGNAVPVYFTGQADQRIDVVFSPDISSFTGANDPNFLTFVENWVNAELFTRDVFLVNQDLFNLWIATDQSTAGGFTGGRCLNAAPAGFDTTYAFAESVGIVHNLGLRDCAQGRLWSSDTLNTITHEMGHTPFGLPDEYCCDGGYWQPANFPSVYTSSGACQADAPNVGRAASACRSWVSTRVPGTFWTSEPASNDLMNDNLVEQALDIRRIAWVLNDAARTTEVPGGAGEPETAPIPPEPAAPGSKAYRITGTVDADGGLRDATVELFNTYERYVGDRPPELSAALATWTGNSIGEVGTYGVLDTHTYDQDTGLPGPTVDVASGRLDLLIPFSPQLFEVDLVDLDGVSLGSVVLDDAIKAYCSDRPLDVDCQAGYDLEVVDVAGTASAELGLVGEPITIDVTTTVANNGPAPEAPALLDVSSGSGGPLTLAPAVDSASAVVATGSPWEHASSFTAECADSGTGVVSLTAEVAPGSDTRLELDPDNDVGALDLAIECLLPVALNIRPGQEINRVNAGNGRVSFAVMTTETGEYGLPAAFDAAWIDPASVVVGTRSGALAGTGAPLAGNERLRDAKEPSDEKTRDRDVDFVGQFRARPSGLTSADTEACVVGTFTRPDGTGGRFIGCDSVRVAG